MPQAGSCDILELFRFNISSIIKSFRSIGHSHTVKQHWKQVHIYFRLNWFSVCCQPLYQSVLIIEFWLIIKKTCIVIYADFNIRLIVSLHKRLKAFPENCRRACRHSWAECILKKWSVYRILCQNATFLMCCSDI